MTQNNEYTYLDTAATTQIFLLSGTLVSIVIGETAAGSIKVIDGAGTASNIAELKASIVEGEYKFNCRVKNGLKIIAAANTKFTVLWKK